MVMGNDDGDTHSTNDVFSASFQHHRWMLNGKYIEYTPMSAASTSEGSLTGWMSSGDRVRLVVLRDDREVTMIDG